MDELQQKLNCGEKDKVLVLSEPLCDLDVRKQIFADIICFQRKMSFIVISCRVIVLDTVQAVLYRMIMDFLIAQVIADRIRITKDINIPIFPEIHRHIGFLQLRTFCAESMDVRPQSDFYPERIREILSGYGNQ